MKRSVISLVDRRGWAFNNDALQVAKRLSGYEFDIVPMTEVNKARRSYEAALCFWWGSAAQLARYDVAVRRLLVGLYDTFSWPENRGFWTSVAPQAAGWFVANDEIAEQLKVGLRAHTLKQAPIWTIPDGVDPDEFPLLALPDKFTCGWTGNSEAAGDLKGLPLIREACAAEGVPLVVQDWNGSLVKEEAGQLRHDEMSAKFYARVSAYVCASRSEGTPNPVLEALSSGRPPITTQVGITGKVVRHGVNGFFVDRTVESLRGAIRALKDATTLKALAQHARPSVVTTWSWAERVLGFEDMLAERKRPVVAVVGRFAVDPEHPTIDAEMMTQAVVEGLARSGEAEVVRVGAPKSWLRADVSEAIPLGADEVIEVGDCGGHGAVGKPRTVLLPYMTHEDAQKIAAGGTLTDARVRCLLEPMVEELRTLGVQDVERAALPVRIEEARVADVSLSGEVAAGRKVWLCLGSLTRDRRVPAFISAWLDGYAKEHTESSLFVYGDGPDAEKVEEITAGSSRVGFSRAIPNRDRLARLYATVTGVVFPDYAQPWGVLAEEAALHGCPVVAVGCKWYPHPAHMPSLYGLDFPGVIHDYRGGFGRFFEAMKWVEENQDEARVLMARYRAARVDDPGSMLVGKAQRSEKQNGTREVLDLSNEVTVFVTTVGEPDFPHCMAALYRQDCLFRLQVIRDVAPMSAAFQKMIDDCRTPFYIQVDADMLLYEDAVRRLYDAMRAASPTVAIWFYGLHDVFTGLCLTGVKIYRHEVMKRFPYDSKDFSCEVGHNERLKAAGYEIQGRYPGLHGDPKGPSCVGDLNAHWTPWGVFEKYSRDMQKYRRQPGHQGWMKILPGIMLARLEKNAKDRLALFGLLGCSMGLTAPLNDGGEKDFRQPEYREAFEALAKHLGVTP